MPAFLYRSNALQPHNQIRISQIVSLPVRRDNTCDHVCEESVNADSAKYALAVGNGSSATNRAKRVRILARRSVGYRYSQHRPREAIAVLDRLQREPTPLDSP